MQEIALREDERLDDLQLCGMRILQKREGFRFGMDAVLLSDFADFHRNARVADFGTGTGILPLLLLGKGKGSRFEAFELQEDMADMAARTMALNGVEDRISIHCLPVEEADSVLPPLSLDGIVCNPPYGIPGTTLLNPMETRRLSRHQGERGLTDWYAMAYRLLKGKGRFFMVYPAPRMYQAMKEMEKAGLTPKSFRCIYPRADKPANLVLIEGMKDAKPMLHPAPPLIVYEKDGTMTDELKRIYGTGGEGQ